MAAFMLEDLDGSLEVVAFPETFRKFAPLIENDAWCWSGASSRPTTTRAEDPGHGVIAARRR